MESSHPAPPPFGSWRQLRLAQGRHQGLPGCPWPKSVPWRPGTSPWASGRDILGLSPSWYMLLPPSCGAGWIFRDLSLRATGTPSGRPIGLSRLLPKCPELLEKLTLPSAVPVTQETISQHQTSPQEGARVLPELCSLVLKKVSERFWPLSLC